MIDHTNAKHGGSEVKSARERDVLGLSNMFCSNCSAEVLSSAAKFCYSCGRELDVQASAEPKPKPASRSALTFD